MALGDNTAFFNETTFGLADEQTTANTGISGIKVSDSSAAKVLFNIPASLDNAFTSLSATLDGVDYHLNIDTGYDGSIIAIINGSRKALQFTYSLPGTGFPSQTAEGHNSVGPTLRRLYHLGYV